MKCMTRYDEYRTIKTQESIRQQLMSGLELESSALDQEIINVAELLLGLAEPGPQLAIWDTTNKDPIIIGEIHFESLISVLVIHI